MQSALVGLLLLPLCASATLSQKRLRGLKGGLATDSCACLPWKETYASGSATCGDTFEWTEAANYLHFSSHEGKAGPNDGYAVDPSTWISNEGWQFYGREALSRELCTGMYLNMPGSMCVRVAPANDETKWYGKTWCYVSSECQNLNGGLHIANKTVSAKFCEAGMDDILGEKSPQELKDLYTAEYDASHDPPALSKLLKMAYPNMGNDFSTVKQTEWQIKTAPTLESHHENKFTCKILGDAAGPSCRVVELNEARKKKKPVVWYDTILGGIFVVAGQQTWDFSGANATCAEGCTQL